MPGAANIRARWRRCAPAAFAFCKLDVLHRRNLEIALALRCRAAWRGATRNLNLAWHRLDAWPDVPSGLARLKRKFLLAPVSNGNISLMVDLARRNNLPWDAILGAEIAGDYKPKPKVYLAAAAAFDLAPDACMMVAAHSKRSGGRGGARASHRARGAAERAWTRPRRTCADRSGRFRGEEPRGVGGETKRVGGQIANVDQDACFAGYSLPADAAGKMCCRAAIFPAARCIWKRKSSRSSGSDISARRSWQYSLPVNYSLTMIAN